MTNVMLYHLDPGAYQPTKAHDDDAGWDLYSREDATIYPGESCVFDTGVHIDLPRYAAGLLVSKRCIININTSKP